MNKNSDEENIRLNKFIAQSGLCSRRKADNLILKGKVSVNGKTIKKMGIIIKKTDKVKVDNKNISPEKKIYILLNKPEDFITTNKGGHVSFVSRDISYWLEKQLIRWFLHNLR